jgi:hypothetical protein
MNTYTGALWIWVIWASTATISHTIPIWILLIVWVIWWLVAVVNSKEISANSLITYLVSWWIASASATRIIVDKFFLDAKYVDEYTIWIAFLIWLLAHIFILKILWKKEKIANIVTDNIEKSIWWKISKEIFTNEKKNDNN